MAPKPETITEFCFLYYFEFGEVLSRAEATRMWLDLMDFMTLLFKKTPEEMRQSSSGSGSFKRERTRSSVAMSSGSRLR